MHQWNVITFLQNIEFHEKMYAGVAACTMSLETSQHQVNSRMESNFRISVLFYLSNGMYHKR